MNRETRLVKVSSPGKIILSGEHSVVYGEPAIVASIDKRLHLSLSGSRSDINVIPQNAEYFVRQAMILIKDYFGTPSHIGFNIEINSQIPIGCGMGSSAAFSVALSAAFFKLINQRLDLKKVNEIAYLIEKKHHGNPSGVDNTISTYGGLLWFRKESESFYTYSQIKLKRRLPRVFIFNTGKPEESTKEIVKTVADLYKKNPKKTGKIIKKMGIVTKDFLKYLMEEDDVILSQLIKDNEMLLEDLSVVSKDTEELIRRIEKIGGSAKISGAGGIKNGSGILLLYHPKPAKLMSFFRQKNIKIEEIKLGTKGVKVE